MSNDAKLLDRGTIAQMLARLPEEDLIFLNNVIVDLLRLIDQAKSASSMARFYVGARVEFMTREGHCKVGTIMKLNQKTASIRTVDGGRWKVPPEFLNLVKT